MYVFLLGKAAGFLLGLIMLGNLPGAFLGLFLGHLADRSFSARARGFRTAGPSVAENRRQVFFAATFRVMGHIAKADGRVSEEEIRAAREIMQGMRLSAAQMQRAIDCFNEGKSPYFNLDRELASMNEACRGQPLLRQFFLHTQFFMAFAHGDVTREERATLNRIGAALGLSQQHIRQLEAQARLRFGFADGAFRSARPSRMEPLGDAYRALGVKSGASDQEIKTAYRRLMKENHPDKLVARGLPEAMMARARERTREVNRAYERIKAHRGIR